MQPLFWVTPKRRLTTCGKIPGLMYEAGISALKLQNFSIKIEIDTNPPEGAILKTDIVNKYFPLSFYPMIMLLFCR